MLNEPTSEQVSEEQPRVEAGGAQETKHAGVGVHAHVDGGGGGVQRLASVTTHTPPQAPNDESLAPGRATSWGHVPEGQGLRFPRSQTFEFVGDTPRPLNLGSQKK